MGNDAGSKALPLRWGIVSTGRIAGVFARGVARSRTGRVVAVGSRDEGKARAFAAEHGLARAHGSYAALLADAEVDAVYVATPHPQHLEVVLAAAEAGKHILCEKPAAMSRAEGGRMVAAARARGVVFMEAFMYRCHPQIARVVALIRDGAIGRVGLVQAAFGFRRAFDPGQRLWSKALGGGGIMDVGCYPVSLARLVAGAAEGRAFLDPVEVSGAGLLHPESGVDVWAAATLKFPGGMVGQVSCGVGLEQENVARIYGTEGWLEVESPWVTHRDGGQARLVLNRAGGAAPEVESVEAGPLYALEADAFGEAVAAGRGEVAAMTPEDTLGNLETLDRWRAAIGLSYD